MIDRRGALHRLGAAVLAGVALARSGGPVRADAMRPVDWAARRLTDLAGAPLDARAFEGRVVLLVNTASRCAFTPQYEGLERLWDRYGGVGLTVLGVPSNDFGRQEPGSNAQIAEFCASTYAVSFPMLEKAHVVGAEAHPLFGWARGAGGVAAVPGWNFHKVLIGRDGRYVTAFPSFVSPDAPEVVAAVERALATPAF